MRTIIKWVLIAVFAEIILFAIVFNIYFLAKLNSEVTQGQVVQNQIVNYLNSQIKQGPTAPTQGK